MEYDGDVRGNGHVPPGIHHSIRPGVPAPETVLVSVMIDGRYLLMAYPPAQPAVLLLAKDAVPPRRELAAAFKTTDVAVHTGRGEAL